MFSTLAQGLVAPFFCIFPKVSCISPFLYRPLTYKIVYRIIYRIEVTAIIDDDLVKNVKAYTQSSTVAEAITVVLKDWLDNYNIKELNKDIILNPIYIEDWQKNREINRLI